LRPDLIDDENPGREDTMEQVVIIDELQDLGYAAIFYDLAINKGKKAPRDVRPVIARLRAILPNLPEEGDEHSLPHPKAEMQELIKFLEKNVNDCEKRREYMWFSYY
jgi:hypothetical protein